MHKKNKDEIDASHNTLFDGQHVYQYDVRQSICKESIRSILVPIYFKYAKCQVKLYDILAAASTAMINMSIGIHAILFLVLHT